MEPQVPVQHDKCLCTRPCSAENSAGPIIQKIGCPFTVATCSYLLYVKLIVLIIALCATFYDTINIKY